MCGLIGLAGDCTLKQKDVFTELLLVDVVRGHHSTGAAIVKRLDDSIELAKGPIPSPMFIGYKEYRDLVDTLGVKVMIGHNRYATVGEKNVVNAHPFKFDNLVGAHNGTLDQFSLKGLDDWFKFGTDSEALYNSVSLYGIKETIGKLTGAWALTWYDKENDTINMLRNNKRPLHYCYSEDRTTLYWASEAHMLEWILNRHNIKIFEKTVYMCDPEKHYRWEIPAKVTDKFDKPVVAEVKERAFISARNFSWKEDSGWSNGYEEWAGGSNTTQYGTPYGSTHNYSAPRTPLLPGIKSAATTTSQKADTQKFRPPYKDASGRVLTKPKFEELVAGGCVFCDNANTVWGEFIHCLKEDIDGRQLYLCEECYNDDDVLQLIENSLD